MVLIQVLHNDVPIKLYELDTDTITVGRLPENTISIASISVSRRHLRVEKKPSGEFFVSDLKSLNGTYYNNKKISEATIQSGESVVIGKYRLEFSDITSVKKMPKVIPPMDAFENEQNINLESPTLEVPTTQSSVDQQIDKMEMTGSEEFSTTYETAVLIETEQHIIHKLDKDLVTLGNSETDDIFVEGFMISDGHIVIEKTDSGHTISANKLMGKFKINGKKEHSHILSHKDRIEIGNSTFRYMEKDK